MDEASSRPVSAAQARDCNLTMEALLDAREVPALGPLSFCPICEDFGVRCRVGNHRSCRTPAPEAPSEFMIHGLEVKCFRGNHTCIRFILCCVR
jgi:hypothetical protein